MKRKSWLLLGAVACVLTGPGSLWAGGVAALGSMRIVTPNSGCDENSFSGTVVQSVLEATIGSEADVLEVHDRPNSQEQYKVKRLRVKSDGVAYPMQWENGTCVRLYSKTPVSVGQVNTLLMLGETAKPVPGTVKMDINSSTPGAHFTKGLYLIVKE